MMAASLHRSHLTAEQREALEFLASDPQGAAEELVVLVHGFDGDMIAGLVHSGLAIARRENMKAGDRAIEVVRIRITTAGRRAIENEGTPS
jgi:hypothetical protein